ncbi:hypothetical protein [Acidaminobacter sp.]|uniref:hypothetical protein n=1 Tax=Acidaminobacter sp. TaxID=1872102 RepID=UPI00137E8462|nr:hypothetical protein [Acidaminobacter sp.]MDK9711371.1 hypothetical protein [Acidaminobacter sp.]MZQ96576.1 hypothetical protein [Acidaminobacter sp.]
MKVKKGRKPVPDTAFLQSKLGSRFPRNRLPRRKHPLNQQAGGLLVQGVFFLVSVSQLRMIFASSGTGFIFVRVTKSNSVRVTKLKVVRVTNSNFVRVTNLTTPHAGNPFNIL